jgi:hypothetical protein
MRRLAISRKHLEHEIEQLTEIPGVKFRLSRDANALHCRLVNKARSLGAYRLSVFLRDRGVARDISFNTTGDDPNIRMAGLPSRATISIST